MEKSIRKKYIDSLKGLACLFIFIGHFYYGFYANVNVSVSIFPWIIMLHKLFFLCFNGAFCVALFSFMSGYLSKKCFGIKDVICNSIKRYFRLMLPIACLCFLIFLMNKLSLFQYSKLLAEQLENPWLDCIGCGNVGFFAFLFNSFLGIMFLGKSNFSTQLWMISSMFIGQIFFFLFCASDVVKKKPIRLIIKILLAISCFAFKYPCLATFLGGVYLLYEKKIKGQKRVIYYVLFFSLFVFGHFRGYMLFNWIGLEDIKLFIQVFIAAGIFIAISNLDGIKRCLEKRVLMWLGSISFEIYLLHILIMSTVSCPLLIYFQGIADYKLAYAITELLTIVTVLVISTIWKHSVNNICGIICLRINKHVDRLGQKLTYIILQKNTGANS